MRTDLVSGTQPGYRQLLARRGTPVFILASLAARLPVVMVLLALILAVTSAYSPGVAGMCAGAMTLASALAGPRRGLLADRLGPRRVLLTSGAGCTLALGSAVAAMRWLAAPAPVLLACCAVAGACTPPVAPVMRTAWRRHLAAAPELLHAAQSWESTAVDVTYVAGPAVVAILASAVSALLALAVAAATMLAGCAALAATRPIRTAGPQKNERTRAHLRPWHVPGLVPLLTVAATTTAAITATELATIHATRLNGTPAAAGWLIAALSAGSIITGLGYGTHRPPGSSQAHLAACCGLWTITQLACTALPPLHAIAALLAIAGAGLAPGITAQYAIAAELAPARAQTETFAWLNSTGRLGSAAAAIAAGWLPASCGYLLSAALAAAALLATVTTSRTRKSPAHPAER
jgi:MFS family permease